MRSRVRKVCEKRASAKRARLDFTESSVSGSLRSLSVAKAAPARKIVLTKETTYKIPSVETLSKELNLKQNLSPGAYSEELRRNLVQPIVLGTGKNIRKMSVDVGSKVKANQQVLLLTEDFDAVPDMYGWTKENVEQFAEWQGLEVNFKGKGSKVVKQKEKVNTDLKKLKKITVTLGD